MHNESAFLVRKLDPINLVLRTREFDLLGNLSFLQVDYKNRGELRTIDFRTSTTTGRTGPAIAQARTMDQLVLVSPWEGIPAKFERSSKFCRKCLSKCDLCDGKGKKQCEAPFCGGAGTQTMPDKTVRTCEVCKGTKLMTCPGCQGQGRRPTGLEGGARFSPDKSTPKCKACDGYRFEYSETAVDVHDYAAGVIAGKLAIGPIVRFTVRPLEGHGTLTYSVSKDVDGDGMILLLDDPKASPDHPCNAYLLGGIAKRTAR